MEIATCEICFLIIAVCMVCLVCRDLGYPLPIWAKGTIQVTEVPK